MSERFERHRQPWRPEEIQKFHVHAKKDMAVKAIAKAVTRVSDVHNACICSGKLLVTGLVRKATHGCRVMRGAPGTRRWPSQPITVAS